MRKRERGEERRVGERRARERERARERKREEERGGRCRGGNARGTVKRVRLAGQRPSFKKQQTQRPKRLH